MISESLSWCSVRTPIRFPRRKNACRSIRSKTEELHRMQEQARQFRILVVEDETKVARALCEGLGRENYEVAVAATGEEGFFRVNAEEFDLVILDLMLPGRDGLEVL